MSGTGNFETLAVETRRPAVLEIAIDRPRKRNAFNETVVEELTQAFRTAAAGEDTRAVVLAGRGPVFSAGADLEWMRAQGRADREANLASARAMAAAFEAVRRCPKPVVARVQGAALGGGSGLVAAADLAVAAEDARIGFTEVRLGILPAVISPYVVEKVGPGVARALFLTGRILDGREARRIGLVFETVPEADLDSAVDRILDEILAGGPMAQRRIKELPPLASPGGEFAETLAEAIAAARLSDEGQEGLAAFLEKRRPRWHPAGERQ